MTDLPVGRIEHISDVGSDFDVLMDGSVLDLSNHELSELRREYAELSAAHADLQDRCVQQRNVMQSATNLLQRFAQMNDATGTLKHVIELLNDALDGE